MRKKKEIIEYLEESLDKVWYMRSQPCDNPEIEQKRKEAVEKVINKYPEVLNGFDDWECGYWNGVLGTLRWVLGEEEKNNLDT